MYNKLSIKRKYPKRYRRYNIHESFHNTWKKTVYDDKKNKDLYASQPLRDDVDLYDIRLRVEEILRNCNPQDVAIAKKQAMRLYKFVDCLINQGFVIE